MGYSRVASTTSFHPMAIWPKKDQKRPKKRQKRPNMTKMSIYGNMATYGHVQQPFNLAFYSISITKNIPALCINSYNNKQQKQNKTEKSKTNTVSIVFWPRLFY